MDEKYIKSFWEKVDKSGDCWLWTAARNKKGYGVAWDGDRTQKAHRVSFFLAHGYMPTLCVLHKCDVPHCVNPDHLFLGTRADNNRDMTRKGRHASKDDYCRGRTGKYPRGIKHPGAVLNPEIVRKIRIDKEILSYSQIARRYGIGMTTAYKAIKGITWSHVK